MGWPVFGGLSVVLPGKVALRRPKTGHPITVHSDICPKVVQTVPLGCCKPLGWGSLLGAMGCAAAQIIEFEPRDGAFCVIFLGGGAAPNRNG